MRIIRATPLLISPLIASVIGLLSLTISLSGCELGGDTKLAQKIRVEVIYLTLIKHKICSDKNSCELTNLARYTVGDQISWRIYSTTDRQIINDMFSNMLAFTKQLPRNKTFSISIYSVSEQDAGFFDKPIAQLFIQGEQ
ncbi:MAG: hypothetical protein PHY62_00260 [Gallionella sp.]|nr:hypothetical protein [Gallionella sp.]